MERSIIGQYMQISLVSFGVIELLVAPESIPYATAILSLAKKHVPILARHDLKWPIMQETSVSFSIWF